jgi:anti-sigma B factor antagonist
MQVQERTVGDVVVVTVTGEVAAGKGSDVRLKDRINRLLHEGHRKLLLDLGGVTYVDSAGLGQLVQLHATNARQEGTLKLLHVGKRLHDLLVITRLLTVFDTFDSEAEAVASFGAATA